MFSFLWGSNQPPSASVDDNAPKFVETSQSAAAVALAGALPDLVFSGQSASYQKSVESYFSARCSSQRPACIFRPATTQHVSTALKTLKPHFDASCKHPDPMDGGHPLQFAIRSGGHAFEGDISSMDGGIVFDLSLLNAIDVAGDRRTTVIGTGNRWADVSTKLDAMGLAVAGGRNSDVGVGGLVLGGGISFLSPRMGMVCDNIVAYEIVLADGTVTHASESENADLWRALKGGSNNFGVVTHFTAVTIPFSQVWGGYFYWTWGQATKLMRAFHDFNQPGAFDEHAAGPILAFGYQQSLGMKGCSGSIIYTKPEPWPAVWAPFRNIWRIWSTAGVKSLTDATHELRAQAPHGNRQALYTTTIKNDLESILHFEELFNTAVEKVRHVKRVVFPLVLQPLTPAVFKKGSPNVLGLGSRPPLESYVIVLACPNWARSEDDALVIDAATTMIRDGQAFAATRGAADPYIYLNYAAKSQDPFASYGEENLKFMQEVSRKYDPDGVFQRAVPGGFKLGLY